MAFFANISCCVINLKAAVASAVYKETENVSQWYEANFPRADPKKISSHSDSASNSERDAKDACTLKIDHQKRKRTTNLRILGVNIDDELTFIDHISDMRKKASQKLGMLARLHNLIPYNDCKEINKYNTFYVLRSRTI